ncbi:MAG TPA: hypothetical protein VFN51_01535 [Candidatus Saccharimonadales bacterium]|nr:hypothetical protein [Candidatus Saccharimonadales bacterium]
MENKKYIISGELEAEQWQALLHQIGFTGLSVTPVNIEDPNPSSTDETLPYSQESEANDEEVINLNDFLEYAKAHDFHEYFARKVWGLLTSKYYFDNVNRGFYPSAPSPLVFETAPDLLEPGAGISAGRRIDKYRKELGDLTLNSLSSLLEETYTTSRGKEVKKFRPGPRVLEFLNGIVAEKQEIAEDNPGSS